MLTTFERCPHQYHRQYVQKLKESSPFSFERSGGTIAHSVLQGALEVYRRTGGYPMNLRQRVEGALPSAPYLDRSIWAMDVDRVVSWVQWALSSIDETARVVSTERWLEYQFPGCSDCPPFTLRHRVDLVVEHADGTLEHRDWKCGKRIEVDAVQQVSARIVVRCAYPNHARILSSTAFLTRGVVQIDELTREEVREGWTRIKSLAAQAMAERDWLPISNALCPWCPLYQRGCPLYEAPVDGPDVTTSWLEGAA
jgi:hypothetical protein